MTIRKLTPDDIKNQAREDAADGRTLEEGVAHLAHESELRAIYEEAYLASEQAEVA